MENLWFLVTVVGPILLLIAIICATLRYRARDKRLDPVSDQAARNLRHQLEEEDSRPGTRR